MRSIAACILTVIVGVSVVYAQARVPIVTGDEVARSFLYNVHADCD